MSPSALSAFLPRLVDIADVAGEHIMRIYRSSAIAVDYKADNTPVTQADLAAHRYIAAALRELAPQIPVVSEEDADSLQWRRPEGRFWLIDPLDGTKEFIAHNDEFTVNIALIEDGKTVLGVVGAPALGVCYWGSMENGAYCRRNAQVQAMHVASPRQPLRVVASKSHMNEETRAHLAALPPHETVQIGSSLKFCLIAEGRADYHPRLGPTSEWDTAAAQAVLEAAGGSVRTLAGQPLMYGKPELVNPYFVATSASLGKPAC